MRPRPARCVAFTLVEVTMAIGIFAFVIVAIIGLFSIGLGNVGDSEKKLEAGNIASQILQAWTASPQVQVPGCVLPPAQLAKLDTTPPAFAAGNQPKADMILVDTAGQAATAANARFVVRYRMWKDAAFSPQSNLVRVEILLSWPPTANGNAAASQFAGNQYDVMTSVVIGP